MNEGSLAGKVAVITGAASGMGRAAAERFAAEGARVALADISEDGDEVAAKIDANGGEAIFLPTDVRRPEDVERLVREAEERFGAVHVLYACAGVWAAGTAWETSTETWRHVLDVNVGGTFHLCKFGVPALRRAGRGSVILTASELGLVGASSSVAYCASKGAVVNMARALSVDCGPFGIRVNCLCPGPIDTPMLAQSFRSSDDPRGMEARQRDAVLLRRFGRAEEIAEVAVFLASDLSSYMTGSIVVTDGGATAWYGL